MEIKSDTRNDLFKRNNVSYELESEKNPNFDEMKKMISENIKKPEEGIDVYNIKGKFGSKLFKVYAYVYDSADDLKKAEQKTQKQRKAEKEEAAKPKEEKKEETPTESPAEEKKEESKDETPVEDKKEEEGKAEKQEEESKEEAKE
jgi:ribosomal protein S24E